MNAEPLNFDRPGLVSTIQEWEPGVTSLSYVPVGAGSHHYLAQDFDGRRWFVTVDKLVTKLFGMMGPTYLPWLEIDLEAAFDGLDRAFRTAVVLRDAGLEFVHAPITRPDGGVLTRLGDDYAVSVFPFIDGAESVDGDDLRGPVFEAVGRLHVATDAVPSQLPRHDSLTVPLRQRFLETLDDLRSPWSEGPYGEPTRRLLRTRAGALRDLFDRCEELANAIRAADTPWVITHGQLHEGNIIRTANGGLRFVDLETLAVAPRERDLGKTWGGLAQPRTDADWAAYTSGGPRPDIDPVAVDLYWHIGVLWGVCADTELFRSPHADDPDTRHEWANLQNLLAEVPLSR